MSSRAVWAVVHLANMRGEALKRDIVSRRRSIVPSSQTKGADDRFSTWFDGLI